MTILLVVIIVLIAVADLNEPEPFWALTVVFTAGALVAYAGSELSAIRALVGEDLARLGLRAAALLLGLVVVGIISWRRGFPELNTLLDGAVYGVTSSMGFLLVELLQSPDVALAPFEFVAGVSLFDTAWPWALTAITDAVTGAFAGAAFAAAILFIAWRKLFAIAILLAAVGLDYTFRVAVSEMPPLLGNTVFWINWILGVAVITALAIVSHRSERAAITEYLVDDPVIDMSPEEAAGLLRPIAMRVGNGRLLVKGQWATWRLAKRRHNDLVTLALLEARMDRAGAVPAKASALAVLRTRLRPSDSMEASEAH